MKAFHSLSLEELQKYWGTNFTQGLNEAEVQQRREKFGPNELPREKPPAAWLIFINQFKSPLVYILVFAALVSFFLKHWADVLVIGLAVILNTILGFIQEYRALNILSQLKKMVHYQARVVRQGREKLIATTELVPGDVLILEAGDKIPADGRLIRAREFQTIEAALTGESAPVKKEVINLPEETPLAEQRNMVFMGTVVSRGRAEVLVVATGARTQFGHIARLVATTTKGKTPLQQQVAKFSYFLTRVVVLICFFIFVLGIIEGKPWFEMLTTAVAVAVASIPEGLLVALTVTLALGMQRILRGQGLVRHLVAAETLGSTEIICTDKTGTLTSGEMRVSSFHLPYFPARNSFLRPSLLAAALANNAVVENPEAEPEQWRLIGDPLEKALLLAVAQRGLRLNKLPLIFPRLDEIPFNEERKMMATLHQFSSHQRKIVFVKGAPEIILQRSKFYWSGKGKEKITPFFKQKVEEQLQELNQQGERTLALAFQFWDEGKNFIEEELKDLVYLGLVAFQDPLRPEVQRTINLCRKAGIKPILITGDHRLTALAIAQKAGWEVDKDSILEGREIDLLSPEEFAQRVEKVEIYARVTPEHKLRIIEAWQKKGKVVAMTGDGVNDAPALKKADIGVALGSGTDVAKEAADLILLDDRFSTIVAAVKQGRILFDNLRKIITYLLADAFSEMILVTGGLILGTIFPYLPTPILAGQILWINLITDGLPHLALSLEPAEADVMQRPPRPKDEPLLNTEMKWIIFGVGVLTDLILLSLFFFLGRQKLAPPLLRTIIFAGLGIDSLFYVFSCKSLRRPLWRINPFSNRWLLLAVAGGWLMQLAAIYFPPLQQLLQTQALPWGVWLLLITFALLKVGAIELVKEIWGYR